MKFALFNGQRRIAEPSLSGNCPMCGAATIAKCGENRIWHWAHKGKQKCDPWWENETEWHRNWKSHFPTDWQEVPHRDDDGEKHIADVKTDQGWAIEFQHSYIKPEERQSREAFYGDMAWVVDGLRRKNDLRQFVDAVKDGIRVCERPLVVVVHPLDCRLVDEWSTSRVPVFFDFGDKIHPHGLWLLIQMRLDSSAYIVPVGNDDFITWHRKGNFNPQPLIDKLVLFEQSRKQKTRAHFVSQKMPWRIPRRSRRRF
ncbi:MAG: hypothetical protein H6907_09905 [Hyphomicrobiales bacterium]|nr:hypothetical protein [Hyphomicrobiales bacterium]MCP5372032.1 hypothetical protein [Hyphomicrobiales bacterium]